MKNHKKSLLFVLYLMALFTVGGFCDNISISASVDKNTAQVGEQVNLQISVSGDTTNIPEPALPPLSNFTVYSSGRSQNISIINGKMSSSVVFNYAIVPNAEGKQNIGSARVNFNGQEYKTQPIEINVTGTAAPPPIQQTPTTGAQPAAPPAVQGQKHADLFVEAAVDKKTAYVNEQITLSFRFYRKINLLSQPQYQPPATTGFLSEDLPPLRNYYTNIAGSRYLVTEVKTALFPASAGRLTIGAASLRCVIDDAGAAGDDFFARFFSQGRQVVLQSEPITVTVIELPREGKPDGFTGAVGRFTVKSYADKTSLETGEALTFSVTVSGAGNVKTITEPKIAVENFRKYDTAASLNVEKKDYVVSGSKTFKTVLIPAIPGRLTIPAVKFSYFDVSVRTYRTIETTPVFLSVKQGKTSAVLPQREGGQSGLSTAPAVPQDIRYIKTKISGSLRQKQWRGDVWFFATQFLPLVAFLTFWKYNVYREKLSSDVGFMRLTRSYKNASKRLKNLEKQILADKPDVERACGEIFDILSNYIGDKLNISAEGMTPDLVCSKLAAKECPQEFITGIKELWEEISFCRYAPASADADKISTIMQRAGDMIKVLEKSTKWK